MLPTLILSAATVIVKKKKTKLVLTGIQFVYIAMKLMKKSK